MNNDINTQRMSFLIYLQDLIESRRTEMPEGSYTSKLFRKGTDFIAKKVGEEATELVIEACKKDNNDAFLNEAADLLYHMLVLLAARDMRIEDVVEVLEQRHKSTTY
jgi:phosphoribosyl-ATP pyrophosphohydrolase/phosphoribosyl-AMP cyclohydrolase